jgi:hypothetical protein
MLKWTIIDGEWVKAPPPPQDREWIEKKGKEIEREETPPNA